MTNGCLRSKGEDSPNKPLHILTGLAWILLIIGVVIGASGRRDEIALLKQVVFEKL